VFENRVLRGVFGSKRDGVTGEWRRLHNEELHKFVLTTKYYSGDEMEDERGGACST
jgi:hypothetical protein